MRHRKTRAELATEALAQAGLRAPNVRSFALDSEEAHEALCTPPDRLLIRGCLPRENGPFPGKVQGFPHS